MPSEPFLLYISSPTDFHHLDRLVRLDESGHVELTIRENRGGEQRLGIGQFEAPLDPEEAGHIRDMVEALLRNPPPPEGPVPPGSPFTRLRLVQGSEDLRGSLSPGLLYSLEPALVSRLEGLTRRPELKLVRVLRCRVKATPLRLSGEQSITLEVSLQSRGAQALAVAGPFQPGDEDGLRLKGERSDIDELERWPEHVQRLRLERAQLTHLDGPEVTEGGRLLLGPGQTASYTFSLKLGWAPGEYHLTVAHGSGLQGEGSISGQCYSLPVRLLVEDRQGP